MHKLFIDWNIKEHPENIWHLHNHKRIITAKTQLSFHDAGPIMGVKQMVP
jgi:hypothetical protein